MARESSRQASNGVRLSCWLGPIIATLVVMQLPATILVADDFPACATATGSCLTPHPTPGCESIDCCNQTCEFDPFCCEVWDDVCAAYAYDTCDAEALCPGQEECYGPHASAGCSYDACCADVCNERLECCQFGWTEECVELAFALCPCGAPDAETCSAPHESEGCDDRACCERTCGVDQFCCDAAWDDICATEASRFCDPQFCTLQCPAGALSEPESCGTFLNDGCNGAAGTDPDDLSTPLPCGQTVCGRVQAKHTRDTDWYRIAVSEPARLTWTVAAEFPAAASIVAGSCAEGFGALQENWCSHCESAVVSECVQPGTYFLFVAPATMDRTLRAGVICPECPADFTDNGVVNAFDLAELLSAWGPNPGHPADLSLDGLINAEDLYLLLSSWGPCPVPPDTVWGTDYVASLSCEPCEGS